jgi:ADP-heptose:LPS heptosyltransferase
MLDNKLQKFLFHLTSLLTTWFPRFGAWFFNTTLPPIVGNKFLVRYLDRKNLKALQKVEKFERILVIPDVHIGDAIMMQAAVTAFRDFFPNARIDYVVKKAVACILEGNPDVSNLYPVFTGAPLPNQSDIEHVKRIVAENHYDLCFNCSPFFEDGRLFPPGQKILNLMSVAPQMVRNDIEQKGNNHFLFQSYEFPRRLLEKLRPVQRPDKFKGVPLTLADTAIDEAKAFLSSHGITGDGPILFFNPDTASQYTRIPFEKQVEFLKLLARLPGQILLGSAFTARGIEAQLIEKMTTQGKSKFTIVPTSMSLDGYSALIDFTDVFISGDTGPLHMAAARKVSKSGNYPFRNRTFVISIFGATPPRMSGYDSTHPLYPAANQDTLSKTYVSESLCRNITCVNKMAKTCKVVRCFEVLDIQTIFSDIQAYLNKLSFSAAR